MKMSEINTYKLIKEKLQAIPNQRLKGSLFEKVCKRFLEEHDSANEYESIKLWSDWELRGNKSDCGIDMVIQTTSKEYIAVQCKFHQNSVSLNKLATFFNQLLSGVGEVRFKKGIIITTSNLSANAQQEIEQIYASIVCSDDKVGKSKNEDNDDINFSELPLKPSTRLEDILSVYEKAKQENKRFIIFSTYQSALRIKEAQERGLDKIDLMICDEAHRTVGAMFSTNERDDKNAFTLCHSDGNINAKQRLYMTATQKHRNGY